MYSGVLANRKAKKKRKKERNTPRHFLDCLQFRFFVTPHSNTIEDKKGGGGRGGEAEVKGFSRRHLIITVNQVVP